MADAIAVLNAGSSSFKFSLFADSAQGIALVSRGQAEGLYTSPRFLAKDGAGATLDEKSWGEGVSLGHAGALDYLVAFLRQRLTEHRLVGVGHRVVHGGPEYAQPVRVDASVLAALEKYVPLAPLHQPHNLAPIRALLERLPQLPQIACFDTAFHRGQPPVAQAFALPKAITERGVIRYGFHGLSYEYVAGVMPEYDSRAAAGKVVVLHLGNGSSMCAIAGGRSVASTMGFTAADGLPMGTRCGNLDPGVVLYLMDELEMDARAIEKLIYQQSGLLGVSGISSDMRTLEASNEPGAKAAIDLYVYRIGRELGSLAAALGGIDAIVFTAGIGENSRSLARARLPRRPMARCGAGCRRQPARRRTNQHRRESRVGVGHSNQRGTHDRAPHLQRTWYAVATGARMSIEKPREVLKGKKALVVGIANEHSIAYGCAKAFRELGADLAITYLNEKARPYVEPLARELEAPLFLPLDVGNEGALEEVFAAVAAQWGALDILVHSIAFAPKEDLQGGLLNCSAAGFAKAMDVSCHSFVRMARLAAPLMKDGGTMFAMSYHGASKVVPTYSVMGPVKAALEASCRYLAYELGGKGIRVHAISPGPLKTRAASGLKDFDLLLTEAAQRAPIGELVDIMDVGFTCAFLATPYARRLSGETLYVDGGVNIMA